jgi:hypothetical protein
LGAEVPGIQSTYDGPTENPQEPDASSVPTAESKRHHSGCKSYPIKQRNPFNWGDSWVWEIGSEALSIVCLALLIGFLVYVNGAPYSEWQYQISPNSVVSIIATVAKAALLVPVSACIGQLKWAPSSTPAELYRLQAFDEASRGPWGSLGLALTTKPSLATMGSILMALSLAIDPFAQQVLSFPLRTRPDSSTISYIPRAQEYQMNETPNSSLDLTEQSFSLSLSVQLAIVKGLFQEGGGAQPLCPSGNCTFPDFVTMGFCSQCEDVSSQVNQSCSRFGSSISMSRPNISDGCLYQAPRGFQFNPLSLGSA